MIRRACCVFIGLLFLLSCEDSFKETEGWIVSLKNNYIAVSSTSISMPYSESTATLEVKSQGTAWQVKDLQESWLRVSPISGSATAELTLSASENNSADSSRLSVFYISSISSDYDYKRAISVSQAAAIPSLSTAESTISFPGCVSEYDLKIESNCKWTFAVSQDWVHCKQVSNGIHISVDENQKEEYRSAEIVISYRSREEVISVKQAPATIQASSATITVGKDAGYVVISITSEADWKASTSDSWITVSPEEGQSGTSDVKVYVTSNSSTEPREGLVSFGWNDKEKVQIKIVQKGIFLEVEANESYSSNEESYEWQINSNASWVVEFCPEWILLDKQNGTDSTTIKATVKENCSVKSRSGVVKVSIPECNKFVNKTVTQQGKYLTLQTTVVNFSADQGQQSVSIQTDGLWDALTNESWISVLPLSAKGDTDLNISVTENLDYAERNGMIDISMYDYSNTILVNQQAKYFSVKDDALVFASRGGVLSIDINTNDEWEAKFSESVDWATLSVTNGSGPGTISVDVQDNPSLSSRSTELLITPKNSQSQGVRIVVQQDSRYMTVDTQKVFFYYRGGESEVININTDADFEINSEQDWIQIERIGDYSFKIYVNSYSDRREGLVTLVMKGLQPEESYKVEIPVIQASQYQISQKRYGVDSDWNIWNGNNVSVSIVKYASADSDWNLK